MKIDLSQFRQTFLQESAEHVESMEAGLLALRSAPDDVEILNAIFRSAHSIKGGAGSFGRGHNFLTATIQSEATLEAAKPSPPHSGKFIPMRSAKLGAELCGSWNWTRLDGMQSLRIPCAEIKELAPVYSACPYRYRRVAGVGLPN